MANKKQKDEVKKISTGAKIFIGVMLAIIVMISFGIYATKMANGEVRPKPFAFAEILKHNKNAITLNVIRQTRNEDITNFESADLARVFYKYTKDAELKDNQIFMNYAVWTFNGDGFCREEWKCFVAIDINGAEPPNEPEKDVIVIPIYNNDGLVSIPQEEK